MFGVEIKRRKLTDSFLVLTVYDMIAVDTSLKEKKKVKEIIKVCMPFTVRQELLDIDVTFPVDLTVGKCWVQ